MSWHRTLEGFNECMDSFRKGVRVKGWFSYLGEVAF